MSPKVAPSQVSVLTRVKTLPIARKLVALRREPCPAQLSVNRIWFLRVSAAVVIKHEVGVHLQVKRVRRLDEIEEVGLGTEPRRHTAFLIKLAEVVIIVRVVAHRFPAGCLVCRRKPQGGKTSLRDGRQFRFDDAPPLVFAVFRLRTIPIKRLQHYTHNSPSSSTHESLSTLHGKLGLTRSNQVTEMLRTSVPPCIVAAFLVIAVTSCEKNGGEAVVLTKEHIDAALPIPETPSAQSTPGPDAQLRPMADDEIEVDGYVMKPGARGTSRDPRALKHEQWIVKVRMVDNGRTFQVPADQARWEKLRENDRVKVKYRAGKYTGTVWSAEIE